MQSDALIPLSSWNNVYWYWSSSCHGQYQLDLNYVWDNNTVSSYNNHACSQSKKVCGSISTVQVITHIRVRFWNNCTHNSQSCTRQSRVQFFFYYCVYNYSQIGLKCV